MKVRKVVEAGALRFISGACSRMPERGRSDPGTILESMAMISVATLLGGEAEVHYDRRAEFFEGTCRTIDRIPSARPARNTNYGYNGRSSMGYHMERETQDTN